MQNNDSGIIMTGKLERMGCRPSFCGRQHQLGRSKNSPLRNVSSQPDGALLSAEEEDELILFSLKSGSCKGREN